MAAGLKFGTGLDVGEAALAGVGLLAALGAFSPLLPNGSSADAQNASQAGEGRTLTTVPRVFVGRDKQWADIKAMVPRRRREKASVAVMIHGMPGVGKSAFAVYAAHKLVDELSRYARRRHLDMLARQVDLYGLEGVPPADPSDALRDLLPDGSSPRLAKMNPGQLSAEWRKYLDGKFLVLVLDNAGDEAQVKPFLPGGAPYIVLITGRRMLRGLSDSIEPYPLGVLSEGEAATMMEKIVRRPLADGDQDAIAEIAELCGYLPKAIQLVVSPVEQYSDFSFTARLTELKAHENRVLAIDEYAGDSEGMARSFDLSYTRLPDKARLVLRRLGIAPVPVVNAEAATALAGLPLDEVTDNLHLLADAALIDRSREGYQLHDLVRHYARSLAASDDPRESEAAVNRLLSYYREAAAYADTLLTRQPPPAAIEPPASSVRHDFDGIPSVIKWVRAELPNLLACADYAVRNAEANDGREENAWVVLFATSLAGILRNESLWRRSIELQKRAVTAAEKIQERLAVANALSELGMLYRLTAQLDDAAADLTRAISIYREVGGAAGRTGEAHALNTYGVVLDLNHEDDESKRVLSEALDIHRGLGDPLGEANVLHDQGMAELFAENGDREMAVRLLAHARDLFETAGHPLGLAHAYNNLAKAQHAVGEEAAAARNLQQARDRHGDLGNRLGKANALVLLGTILRQQNPGEAVTALNEALNVGTEIGNQLVRIQALEGLAEISLAAGRQDAALDTWSRALAIAREHGMEREETRLTAKVEGARSGSAFQLRRFARRIGFLRRWNR